MRDMRPSSQPAQGGDRSIRNIPVPANHRRAPASYEEDFIEEPQLPQKKRGRWFWRLLLGVVVLCAVAGLLLSTLFAGVTVRVTPRNMAVTPPASVAALPAAEAGALAYQVVTTSRSASTTVQANGTQQVSLPASGVIAIYNDYSAASQKLVATTRFEAPNGDIYRIHQNVIVPGATKNADSSLSPGTVSVTAYADQPGASYNLGPTQFTIPGFKGNPQYTKFYAQTSAMTGGFVGTEPAVAPGDLTNAEQSLKQALDASMQSAAATQIPQEFILIPGTLTLAYGDIARTANSNDTVTLSQTASGSADILRADDLAAAIAKQTVQGYNGEAVGFADPSQITIALAASSSAQGVLQINLSGTPTLVWQFDANALKQALLGKPKSSFQTTVETFAPAIECTQTTPCSASIRPFWISTFPSDPNKITIVTGQ